MSPIDKQKAEAAALRSVVAERHADAAETGAQGGNFIRHADGSLTADPDHPVTKPYERDLKREAAERAAFDAEIAAAQAEADTRAAPKPKVAPVAATEADLQSAQKKR